MTVSEALDRLRKAVGPKLSVYIEFKQWDYGTVGMIRPYRGEGEWVTYDETEHLRGLTIEEAVEAMERKHAVSNPVPASAHDAVFAASDEVAFLNGGVPPELDFVSPAKPQKAEPAKHDIAAEAFAVAHPIGWDHL